MALFTGTNFHKTFAIIIKFHLKLLCNNPIFDSQIYQNTAESLILFSFFSGVVSFYYIVFFLNQIWRIDFYDFSRVVSKMSVHFDFLEIC